MIAKVPDWIKSQPAYLQGAMQAVYDQGDAESVIALVADFKKATGVVTTTTTNTAATDAQIKAKAVADAKAARRIGVGGCGLRA